MAKRKGGFAKRVAKKRRTSSTTRTGGRKVRGSNGGKLRTVSNGRIVMQKASYKMAGNGFFDATIHHSDCVTLQRSLGNYVPMQIMTGIDPLSHPGTPMPNAYGTEGIIHIVTFSSQGHACLSMNTTTGYHWIDTFPSIVNSNDIQMVRPSRKSIRVVNTTAADDVQGVVYCGNFCDPFDFYAQPANALAQTANIITMMETSPKVCRVANSVLRAGVTFNTIPASVIEFAAWEKYNANDDMNHPHASPEYQNWAKVVDADWRRGATSTIVLYFPPSPQQQTFNVVVHEQIAARSKLSSILGNIRHQTDTNTAHRASEVASQIASSQIATAAATLHAATGSVNFRPAERRHPGPRSRSHGPAHPYGIH